MSEPSPKGDAFDAVDIPAMASMPGMPPDPNISKPGYPSRGKPGVGIKAYTGKLS